MAPANPPVDVAVDWEPLDRELDRWRRSRAVFWWRDDDAAAETPALQRLLELRRALDIPLALSVIPAAADPQLRQVLEAHQQVVILQHGWDHVDHGDPGRYKAELSDIRRPDEVEAQLRQGREVLDRAFGALALPVLVPPYDYLARHLVATVRRVGYSHVSVHGDFRIRSMACRNVHVDLIDWDSEQAIPVSSVVRHLTTALRMRRYGLVKRTAPIGIKTHHLQHDEPIWNLSQSLLERLRAHDAAVFPPIREIFA